MDYERIEKPLSGGGGFSPAKVRAMLLGVEKKRKEHDEFESTLRSQLTQIDDTDQCKDVNVVSVHPECSTSNRADSYVSQMVGDRRVKDQSLASSRIRSHQDSSLVHQKKEDSLDFDSMSIPSSIFEFQKMERAPQRGPLGPFNKPAPSKWDDAQKWIASPTSNRPKSGQVQGAQGVGSRKMFGYGSRQSSMKVVEVPDQKMVAFEEPDTKCIDMSQDRKETGMHKFISWEEDPRPAAESYGKPVLMIQRTVAESAINLSRHDSISMQNATTFIPPPSTARSVSMRDMGTEMTPIASQEPSRTGTPVRATTPIRSPTSSRPSTPGRSALVSSLTNPAGDHLDPNKQLSEKELQMKTRREIMALGTKLGKMNITAWASKEEEDEDASTSQKDVALGQPARSTIGTRAAAWEDAEKAKYMARFKREEMKIQAWENHQKSKTEAELRKIEVEVERMRGSAHDRLTNKLSGVRHKAEEKRAAAEAKRNSKAVKTEEQAEYIRKTGQIPSSFSCWNCCS